MNQCQTCQGFVPQSLKTCPHCQSQKAPFNKGLKRAGQVLLGASITLTLSACYGAPPASLPACDDSIPDQGSCQIVPSPTPTPDASGSPANQPSANDK